MPSEAKRDLGEKRDQVGPNGPSRGLPGLSRSKRGLVGPIGLCGAYWGLAGLSRA